MKPDSAASGVRSSWLALATKSARISSTRRNGVRSRNAISTMPAGRPASAGSGITATSYQRSAGTRSKNSTRWVVPLARTRRMASRISGLRRASDTGSPRRSAGAIAAAWALKATTSPPPSSATTGSGRPASSRLEQRIVGARRALRVGGERCLDGFAAARRDHGGGRDGDKARERRQRGQRAGKPEQREHRGGGEQASGAPA